MRNNRLVPVIALLMGFFISLGAQAAVVYNNGAAASDSGRCAETSGACDGRWTVFDDFTLSSAATITDIKWTANLYSGLSDYNGARAWIYSADPVFGSGTLLATVAAQVGSPTLSSLGGNFYDIDLSGLSISLGAGTYWLGMQNDTTFNYATVACTSDCTGNGTQWQNDGAGYRFSPDQNYAFSLEANAVPEPASLALLGLGLLGLGLGRRRKQKSA